MITIRNDDEDESEDKYAHNDDGFIYDFICASEKKQHNFHQFPVSPLRLGSMIPFLAALTITSWELGSWKCIHMLLRTELVSLSSSLHVLSGKHELY